MGDCMIKVLIVDDNKIERESLRECINWDSIGAKIIGEAVNAFAALELIIEEPPDILITDIKMPHMTGIELAQRAKSIYPKLKVIFLTGYDEFELAKNAVNLNASGYLLKPVSTSEFSNVLKKVINAAIESNLVQEKEKKLMCQLSELKPILREKFLRDLLLGIEVMDESKLNQKMKFLELSLAAGKFMVLVIHFDDYEYKFDCLPENQKQLLIVETSNILKNMIPNVVDNFFITSNCNYKNGYEVVAILNFSEQNKGDYFDFYDCIELMCQQTQDKVNCECGLSTTIGISDIASYLSELHKLYEQALLASNYKFFKGKGNIIKITDINSKTNDLSTNYLDFVTEITKTLKAGDKDTAALLINNLFHQLSESNVSMKYIQNISIEIICAIKRMLMDTEDNIDHVFSDASIINEKVINMETALDIRICLHNICASVINYFNDKRKDIQTVRVEKVIEIMQEHIESNIAVDEIARQVFLTQNYLRRIFKEKTGKNLLEYYTNLKIEKAKELLLYSNMKINEVARKVGYESTSYFCAVFKDYTSLSPKEYKESQLRRTN